MNKIKLAALARWPLAIVVAAIAAATIVLSAMSNIFGQPDGRVVTPGAPASVDVEAPADAAFLDVGVLSYTPPSAGAVEAVVSLRSSSGEQEVGRFAILPTEESVKKDDLGERTFRLNVENALAALKSARGPLAVTVRLIPTDPQRQAEGAKLAIGQVKFQPRR